MPFIITKASRFSGTPYAGISCAQAKVRPANVYLDKAEAEADAKKLTAVNPVGFIVQEIDGANLTYEEHLEMQAEYHDYMRSFDK